MLDTQKRILAVAVTLLAAIGSASIAVGETASNATQTGTTRATYDGPFHCEIQTSSRNGMITLEGVIQSDIDVNGSYRFRVKNAGRSDGSNIQQGGQFSVRADGTTTLGRVMLGSRGAIYDASLEVTADGETISCDKRVGGNI